jgi:PKD repeat protein
VNWGKRVDRRFVAFGPVILAALAARATAQDLGHEGPSFSGAGSEPTESKPESKLWFHDGTWWGSLWSTSGQAFHIQRLDQRTHLWADTGVPIDFRPLSRCDALLDGDKLYVSSHRFSALGGASGHPIVMLRYGYDAPSESYGLMPGFPVTIGTSSTESVVIDKDSTGTIWAAWVQNMRVVTSHSVGGNDLIWTAPALLPGCDTDLTTDDLCALIHFGGDRVGVMWSDQALNLFRFAIHQDGAPDDQWTLETPLFGESDDHIHLATDAAGRVFATVKNALNEIKLLVRDAGGWSAYLVSTNHDRFTRPIVLLDEERRRIHVFASGQDNGLIHEKTSSLDDIAFASGTGTVVIQDAGDPAANNATSSKQNVDSTTGLVILAGHDSSTTYWHHSVAPDALLVASFSAAPFAGRAPLLVSFTDTSTGTPTSWSWDFGDGGTSSEQNPEHTYTASGTYSVRLTVGGAGGLDEELWSDLITVVPEFPSQSFPALADARVNEANPTSKAGTATDLRARSFAGASYASYLRFDLSGLSAPAVSAKLRLYCTDGSPVGGLVFPTTSTWNETTITWNTRPAATGAQIAAHGPVTPGTWGEFDVSSALGGSPGLVSFLLTSSSANSVFYSSREGSQPPELLVELEPQQPTVADFSADPTSGVAPLTVAFTDLSSDDATSWTWDFGDGSGSSEQNPVHVYGGPGTFTVGLTVSGPGGADEQTKAEYVFVTLPPAPVAAFEAAPTSGSAPLTVLFTDTSSGSASAWLWDFGDGAQSSEQNPTHVYTDAGDFDVTLTATGPGGSDAETRTDLVEVVAPPSIRTLLPVADARVFQASPNANSGSALLLRVLSATGSSNHSYLRFDLSGPSAPVISAKLRLYCTDASSIGGQLYPTSSAWAENTLTWNNKPAASGAQIGALGPVAVGAWVEVDVTQAVAAGGPVSFVLSSTSADAANYSSREGVHPPELVVATGLPQPPVADFSASPTAGVAPLSVAFTDLSGGAPTSWSWDFGDGTGSSAQSPLHVYTGAGTFTVTLTATNAVGSSVLQRAGLVAVTSAPPTQTLLSEADTRVNQASPGTNAGRSPDLRVSLTASGAFQSYLRFDLSALSGPPTSAKLRLYCTDGSPVGGSLFPTTSSWSETTLTWSNKPAASGAEIAAIGAVTSATWVEVDVTAAIGAPGPVSFLLTSSSSDSALYSSREGTRPPELVLTP